MNFENFLEDMGLKPSPHHQIERKNNNDDYRMDNCTWATPQEQQNNKRSNVVVTHEGQAMTIAELARKTGLNPSVIYGRISRGMSVKSALQKPIRGHGNAVKYDTTKR